MMGIRRTLTVAAAHIRSRMDSARREARLREYITVLQRHMDRVGLEEPTPDALRALATTIDWNSEIPPF